MTEYTQFIISFGLLKMEYTNCCLCNEQIYESHSTVLSHMIYCGYGGQYDNLGSETFLYWTTERPNNVPLKSSLCDICITKFVDENILQLDYANPWTTYEEPPGDKQKYSYKIRVFRNCNMQNDNVYNSEIDCYYPSCPLLSNQVNEFYQKLKTNPHLFGEYSEKVAREILPYDEFMEIVSNAREAFYAKFENFEKNPKYEKCSLCSKQIFCCNAIVCKDHIDFSYGFSSRFKRYNEFVLYINRKELQDDNKLCDDCILNMIYKDKLQFDFENPWESYSEPPDAKEICNQYFLNINKYNQI